MRPFGIVIFVAAITFVTTGCVSLSSPPTARTVQAGKLAGSLGLGYEHTKFTKYSADGDAAALQKDIEKLPMPVIEGGLRVGLADHFDAGVKLALLPGSAGFDLKFMPIGKGSSFALATGIRLDYASFEVGGSASSDASSGSGSDSSATVDTPKTKLTITDATVPLYLSYDVVDGITFALTPRYGMRSSKTVSVDKTETSMMKVGGLNVGIKLGWFVADMGLLAAQGDTSSVLQQYTVGVMFGRENLQR